MNTITKCVAGILVAACGGAWAADEVPMSRLLSLVDGPNTKAPEYAFVILRLAREEAALRSSGKIDDSLLMAKALGLICSRAGVSQTATMPGTMDAETVAKVRGLCRPITSSIRQFLPPVVNGLPPSVSNKPAER